MTKFLYLIRGGHENAQKMSPEEMQGHMQTWTSWMKSMADKGQFVDGLPLANEGKCVRNGGEIISDGPYPEGKELVGGYLIINAENLDHAVEISKECPVYEYGGLVEIREIVNM